MKKWGRRLGTWLIGLMLCGALTAAGALWLGNRPAEPVSQEEIEQRYQKAVSWLKDHEMNAIYDANVALWMMVNTAAERTGDPYLHDVVQRARTVMFAPPNTRIMLRRILDPGAQVDPMPLAKLRELPDYQQFFVHALTCEPVQNTEVDTTRFLHGKVCPPMAPNILLGDPACVTHHVMGLQFYLRSQCAGRQDAARLKETLLDDIETQLKADVVMKDAYMQRVLVLVWQGRQDKVKPIWIRRVLDAQEADGGWLGHRRLPELPEAIQPWHWREVLARVWPERFDPQWKPEDFHATAQGLLLLALLKAPPASSTPTTH
ncbi:MAG: hypothetical protein QM742_05575 [Aquabacterium sp.]